MATSVNEAAVGRPASAGEARGLKAIVVGSCVVLWVVSLFAITSLNSLRAEVKELRNTVDTVLSLSERQSLEAVQAIGKDGEVAYTFKHVAPPTTGLCAVSGGGMCGGGAGGAAAGGGCGAPVVPGSAPGAAAP
jgi:hypothetical protein